MPPQALVDVLVAGITVAELRELGVAPRSISLQRAGSDDLVLDPLPNHLFTRDPSAWIGDVAAISPMRHRARRRESLHLQTIDRRHPVFNGSGDPARHIAPDLGQATTATVEGGDVMMLWPARWPSACPSAAARWASSAWPRGCWSTGGPRR